MQVHEVCSCFSKYVILRISQYSQENTCVGVLLYNKVAGIQACNFIKKSFQPRFFPVNIVKIFRTAFFIEHLWWLLLNLLTVVKQSSNFECETTTAWLFLSCCMSVIEAADQNSVLNLTKQENTCVGVSF